jgi:transposase
VSDDLRAAVAPLLPPKRPKPKGGRPRVPDRAALTGILFVLRTGTPWKHLPAEKDFGSGMACWRRRDWQAAGVWARLHKVLLDRLEAAGRLPQSRRKVGRIHRGHRRPVDQAAPAGALAPQGLSAAEGPPASASARMRRDAWARVE